MSKLNLAEKYKIRNVINYLRRSRQDIEHEKKTGEDTLDAQRKLMDRVLADYGIPYDQMSEIGSGDKISTRPVFQKVIEYVKEGKYDAIAVKEISRLGRGSYTDMGIIYDLITEKNIYIITPFRIYDPSNPSDLRQIRFELFMSREEFETTRERLNVGRYNAALEGKWVSGPAPFGYDYDPKTGHLIINEKEAEIVRMIFDFYANGIILENGKRKLVQFRALATYLERIGIKTPTGKKRWTAIQVRQFLQSERFIGVLRQNARKTLSDGTRVYRPVEEHIVVPKAHDPIIDMETWNKVQDRINNREKDPRIKLDFEVCELASICICKKCGGHFIRRASERTYKKKDGSISVYANEFLFCGSVGCTYVKYRPVEKDLLKTLEYLRDLDAKLLEKHLKQLAVEEKEDNQQENVASLIESQLEELKRRRKFIYEKYEAKIYSDEEFIQRRAEIDGEIEKLKNIQMNKETQPKKEAVIRPEFVKSNISTVLEAYKTAASKQDKNKILRSVFDRAIIEVVEKGRGTIPAKYVIEPYLKSSFIKKGV